MKVTIIVPVYNMVKCVARALGSVRRSVEASRGQSVHCEVLVVDDGCEDGTMDVVNEVKGVWETEVNLEHVLSLKIVSHGSNKGIAKARTTGIRNASGNYIGWLDPDDELLEDWYSVVNDFCAVGKYDVLSFDAIAQWENGKSYSLGYGREEGAIERDVFATDVMSARVNAGLWSRIFAKWLFDGKEFIGNAFQDYRMLCEILPNAQSVLYIKKPFYLYHRLSCGISQYVKRDVSCAAITSLADMADNRTDKYSIAMRTGVTFQAADFCRHAGGTPRLRRFIRHNILNIVMSGQPVRIWVKCILAGIGL